MTVVDTAAQAMHFERFYLGCLAHASYVLGSEGEAVVVDPQRDVDLYLQAANRQGLKIRHIFETHLHADFVSGHRELAERTGAKIYIGAAAGAAFPHVAVRHGFELPFGKARITVLETPGHTPESICLLITDPGKSPRPWAVLTGDTLFLGDVGRPDLSQTHSPRQLAGMLYDSLHTKLLTLPDDVAVYPAHGAGSLCGRNMRADGSSTIGIERLTNYALRIPSREEFICELTTNLPTRPEYFLQDAEINRAGATALADLPALPALSAAEVKRLLDSGTAGLDVRASDRFAEGHVPGSLNIALSGQFATWAGTVLGLQARPVLIADSDDQIQEARVRLARVGIDVEGGYLRGGVEGWKSAGFPLSQTKQMTVADLHRCLGKFMVVDVRREPEWRAGHVEGALSYPLDRLKPGSLTLDKKAPLAVHCKSGYRSMIACSLLERSGFQNVTNVSGGLDAWERANLPLVREG
ncbi:MAG TPA: rhodanese-like domain-containing protein [Terriglobales bacterium]|nr:rhodanese-like domain-containing protein [Terriglobales bacterium]